MKKIIICTVISICSIFVLCSCNGNTSGANDELSQKMIDDINSIGDVTIEDEQLITKLVDRYATLTDSQKEQVTNYTVLLNAQDTLDSIKSVPTPSPTPTPTPTPTPAPWDLRGNWCEESVEKGEPGMAAYITDDEMRIYHVSDKNTIFTPYRFGTYEVEEGKDSFNWVSTNNKSLDADYPLYSDDETKDFSYENGTITFTRVIGGEEHQISLRRTELDFSKGDNITEFGVAETGTIEFFNYTVPNKFGLYSIDESDSESIMHTYITDDAVIQIYKSAPMKGAESWSDSDFNKGFKASTDKLVKAALSDGKESKLIEENNLTIGNCTGYTCYIEDVNTGGMDGNLYFAHFSDKQVD